MMIDPANSLRDQNLFDESECFTGAAIAYANGSANKRFNPQVLPDALEEQLDLPARDNEQTVYGTVLHKACRVVVR